MRSNKINYTFNKNNTTSPVVSITNNVCNKNVISPISDELASDQLPMDNSIVMAKGYSVASSHYWREEDAKVLLKIKDIIGSSVLLPNKETIDVTSQVQLHLSESLSSCENKAIICPGLKSVALTSIGQLCDNNCTVLLNKRKLLAIQH